MNLFTEYATCHACGYKKLCKLENRRYVCRACDKKKENVQWQTKLLQQTKKTR